MKNHILLAWAVTSLFLAQRACAQAAAVDEASDTAAPATDVVVAAGPVDDGPSEHFVPRDRIAATGTLQMLSEAVISGPDVKIRQICRWSEDQSAAFVPIADLVVDHLPSKRPKKITLDDLRACLRDAGVNQGLIQFTGSTRCLVSCSDTAADTQPDTPVDDRTAVNRWLEQSAQQNQTAIQPQVISSAAASGDTVSADAVHSLRDLLLIDLSERLNIPVDRLQMTVDSKDETLLNLAEPIFHFDLAPRRVRDLGKVSWDVTIMAGKTPQKVIISGEARAWEKQLVVTRPASAKQVLREEDIAERRILMDHVDDDPVLSRDQVIGQQASRDLKPGTVMTARLVESVTLAKPGQYVTVTLIEGGVQLKTVAKAMEAGSFGEAIKAKNEQTGDIIEVTLTGPQTATMGPGATDATLALSNLK